MKGEVKWFSKAIEKILQLIYSPEKKYERLVLFLTFIGFLLRIPAALHLDFLADDSIYASQSANIWQAGILSTHSHPPLFFYLTDLAYNVFGYTNFAARFFPLIAGTLLIPLIFLITKKLLGKKAALLAALLATFCNFLVRMTYTEHTLVTFFFIFLGIYLGMLYLETRKLNVLVLSAILFGLGSLTKYNAIFFIISFLIFGMYYFNTKNEKIFSNINFKHIIIFLLIIFLFSLPFIVFNYFNYRENGIVDFQFTRIFKPEKAQDLMGGLAGQDKSFIESLTTLSNYSTFNLVFKTDIIIFILGLLGLITLYIRKQKLTLIFFGLFLFIPFILQSAGNALPKHFAFMHLMFIIPASYALEELISRINKRTLKLAILGILTVFMIFNLGVSYGAPHFYLNPSGASSLKSYVNANVQAEDLIIFDSRDYTAKSFWLATDHNFLLLNQFSEFYNFNLKNSKNLELTNVYLVECAVDDCGWGWVKDKPEINQSAEDIIGILKNYSFSEQRITQRTYGSNEFIGERNTIDQYRVYKIKMGLDPNLVSQTKTLQSFYFTPYLYLNMKVDPFNYAVYGFNAILNKFCIWIIYLSVILAIFSFILVILLL